MVFGPSVRIHGLTPRFFPGLGSFSQTALTHLRVRPSVFAEFSCLTMGHMVGIFEDEKLEIRNPKWTVWNFSLLVCGYDKPISKMEEGASMTYFTVSQFVFRQIYIKMGHPEFLQSATVKNNGIMSLKKNIYNMCVCVLIRHEMPWIFVAFCSELCAARGVPILNMDRLYCTRRKLVPFALFLFCHSTDIPPCSWRI
jgi:hypothetical protein